MSFGSRRASGYHLAFHKSGKPRGWFRALSLNTKKNKIRFPFERAFFKKNGQLRSDFGRFVSSNPAWARHYFGDSGLGNQFNAVLGQHISGPVETARQIFTEQQAELDPKKAAELVKGLAERPLISVIMPVYKTPLIWLQKAVESLQSQYYDNWELCVVDDQSPSQDQRNLLAEMAKDDPRIRLLVAPKNGGISAASNLALDMAKGSFIALLDHDDELTPDALLRMVEAINAEDDVDFLYSDECKICDTEQRRLFEFIFKPDWSPEIMFNGMISGHLTLYRTSLVREVGRFRSQFDFSQDYDLALRIADVARKIVHVERVLYLWRAIQGSAAAGGKDFARESNIAALQDAVDRRGIIGRAKALPHANYVGVTIDPEQARVAIVIPSDSAKNIRLALDAIHKKTAYANYEVRVVCNSGVAFILEKEYQAYKKFKFVVYDKPYNFSDKCNAGAEAADADIVVFYNDDVFPIKPDWVEELIQYLWVPGVGATSPQLLFENGNIQYAGMITGTPGQVGTAYNGKPYGHHDDFLSMNNYVRNISVLSGACCAMRKDLFLEIGGFDEVNTPDGHSDVDLSFKIMAAGYRCVYTPYSLLTHIGNHSWNIKNRKYKGDIFALKRWGAQISRDPYFTDSMKRVLYTDFTFEYRIYAEHIDPHATYTGPDVLLLSHELTHTGAPHMLLEAARAIKSAGGFPVVAALSDGPLRKVYEREGIAVIIDGSLNSNHFLFAHFAHNFDSIVVNTSILTESVKQLAALPNMNILWWLHESKTLSETISKVPAAILDKVALICVGAYAKSYLPKGLQAHTLYNGIPEDSGVSSHFPDLIADKLKFVLVGTIEPRKGQDIFIEAILALPAQIRENCQFIMAGKLWEGNKPFWQKISSKIENIPEVVYIGELEQDESRALIRQADVLVSASRDDAFSLVAMEAAQSGKALILSDHVGAAEVLDERCSIIFPSEDVQALSQAISQVYLNLETTRQRGKAAREIYLEDLNQGAFSKNFLKLLSEKTSAF